jgi:alpha-beta hydrolase superfamily lysophospholipase
MSEKVLLLHGLWMRSLVMRPLAARLRAQGFAVETIDYASIFRGPAPCIAQVAQRLQREGGATVHLVGHSLGGVIAVRAALAAGEASGGRIVCLGSPLAGSATARSMVGRFGLGSLVGRSAELLARGVEALPANREVGVIAGHRGFGVGRLFHRIEAPNDGTVTVAETRVPGLAGHIEVAVSHTGLVYSREVARLTSQFLREGRFSAAIPSG